MDPDTTKASLHRADLVRTALARWNTGRTIPSFVGSHSQPQRHLDADQIAALDQVRSRIDPGCLFHGDVMPNATARR
jgi:hypothetical protein